ncbi:4-hydroxy-tetrahydrodipicolinate reductase [Ferruginibacter sp.]|uniref:4-hydroxy-tetrahydrodipicolinate reductase n=1 Tax=Ferruginibacter sp. TaxID=1940288 RepID=UPI002658E2C3|nr:4-hydroxy-tetrahydrodipicolinate reductase [Ferruginibacter sp.]
MKKLKIALIGYGKMGKAIEEIALQRGHAIVLKIDINTMDQFTKENLVQCDVAIEFTSPHSAVENIITCLRAGIAIISGSTGWLDRWEEVKTVCGQQQGALLYASNYSVGVNIFFEVNKRLAQLMNQHPDYEVCMTEIHHTEKKDAPSGTAITLAEQILENIGRKKQWVNQQSLSPGNLSIISERIDPAPGTHIVKYSSLIDDIEITHTAHSRKGFATGAVLAAEFLQGKKGIFSMKDVLGF